MHKINDWNGLFELVIAIFVKLSNKSFQTFDITLGWMVLGIKQ